MYTSLINVKKKQLSLKKKIEIVFLFLKICQIQNLLMIRLHNIIGWLMRNPANIV